MKQKLINFYQKVTIFFKQIIRFIFSNNIKKSLIEIKSFLFAKMKYTIELLVLVLIYGLVVMLIDNQLFGHSFGILRTFAFGFIAYIIKLEMPLIISSCFPYKRIQ